MSELFTYIAKVSIALLLFYGLHMLLLRNDTFFKLRRIYFLLSLLFSLVFPFINIEIKTVESEAQLPAYWLSQIDFNYTPVVEASTESFDPLPVLLIAIALGALFFLSRFLVQLASIYRMLKIENPKDSKSAISSG